jgi:hypothetical protein
MLVIHFYALALLAGACTAAWLFRPEERTAVTSLGAFIAWTLTALLGGDVERFDPSVETDETVNNTTPAVEGSGTLVAAPVPTELRLVALLWALLSALALTLYVLGVYPPESEAPADPTPGDNE